MSEYCSILGDTYTETYLGCTICYTTRIVGGAYYSNCVEVYHHDILDAKKDICEQQDGVWDGSSCDLTIVPYWKHHSTYREIDIDVWYPYGYPFRAYFGGAWHEEEWLKTLQAAIDAYIGPEPGPFTSVIDFVVPASLPAGSTVSVRVLAKNTGGTAGRLDVYIDGNPGEEDDDITVATGSTMSVQPGASVWFDITFSSSFNMPDWDYLLTARNYDQTSSISKTITLGAAPPVGIPTTTSIRAPGMVAAGEKFTVYGALTETNTGLIIPDQPINVSYNGKSLGSGYTNYAGTYWIDVSIPEAGTWTLKAEFPGTPKYEASQISKTITVEAAVGIPTTLTISAPGEVGPGETFNILGQLTRDDTGVAIPNMSISVSYNGKSIGSVLTDMQGVYTIPASIPDPGTYTLRADYEGTEGYAASTSVADTTVTATPLEAAIAIAGSAVAGLALIIYGLS